VLAAIAVIFGGLVGGGAGVGVGVGVGVEPGDVMGVPQFAATIAAAASNPATTDALRKR